MVSKRLSAESSVAAAAVVLFSGSFAAATRDRTSFLAAKYKPSSPQRRPKVRTSLSVALAALSLAATLSATPMTGLAMGADDAKVTAAAGGSCRATATSLLAELRRAARLPVSRRSADRRVA